jgi:hypothetical protein
MTDFRLPETVGFRAPGTTDLRAAGGGNTDLRPGAGGNTDLRAGGGAEFRVGGGGATDLRATLAFAEVLGLFLGMAAAGGPA